VRGAGAAVGAVADRARLGRRDPGQPRRFAPDAVGARVYNIAVAGRASPDRRDFGENRRFAPDAVGARVYNILDACTSGEEQFGLV
jgi:hypothetical protein